MSKTQTRWPSTTPVKPNLVLVRYKALANKYHATLRTQSRGSRASNSPRRRSPRPRKREPPSSARRHAQALPVVGRAAEDNHAPRRRSTRSWRLWLVLKSIQHDKTSPGQGRKTGRRRLALYDSSQQHRRPSAEPGAATHQACPARSAQQLGALRGH